MQCRHMVQTVSQQSEARLAQLAERKALNLVVVGSSPTVGVFLFVFGPKHMGTAADMSLWILPRVSS